MSLLPPDDDLDLIHTRDYQVRAYRISDTEMMVRGGLRDVKPAGLFVGEDDEDLKVHEMLVEWRVRMPDLMIIDAEVVFETHPQTVCPTIATHYKGLIGIPIARGFTHKVRELFGGPRGCTHTTALLQAMAPVVMQSRWSHAMAAEADVSRDPAEEAEAARKSMNVNTCHVWDEDGPFVAAVLNGESTPVPLPVARRMVKLGRDPLTWRPGR